MINQNFCHNYTQGLSPEENLFSLKKQDPEEDPMPALICPIAQTTSEDGGGPTLKTNSVIKADSGGLTDYGLSKVFGSTTSSPNTLMSNHDNLATLVMGFPELEFSPSEVYVWPRSQPVKPEATSAQV